VCLGHSTSLEFGFDMKFFRRIVNEFLLFQRILCIGFSIFVFIYLRLTLSPYLSVSNIFLCYILWLDKDITFFSFVLSALGKSRVDFFV